MSVYNNQIVRTFGYDTEQIIVTPQSGVSVVVEIAVGDEWVASADSPITNDERVLATGATLRFTPVGGSFFISDGEAV